MNDKFKKALKIGGIVLGLVAYGLLAFGIGACSTKPVTMVKADYSSAQYPDNPDVDFSIDYGTNDLLIYDGLTIYNRSGDFDGTTYSWANSDYVTSLWRPAVQSNPTMLGKTITAGWYYVQCPSGFFRVFSCENIQSFRTAYESQTSGSFNNLGSWVVNVTSNGYFYMPEGKDFIVTLWDGGEYHPNIYKVDITHSSSWETLETMYLPSDWSPLGMVGSNINAQGNMLYDTPWLDASWQTPIPRDSVSNVPYLPIEGMFFRNQGQLFNRIVVEFDNLNGKDYTPDGVNVLNGTASDWYVSAVRYQLVNGNGEIMQNYVAGSPRYVNKGSDMVLALGIKWTIPSAQKLDILVRNTYTHPFEWANNRFYARGVYTTDPATGERVKPIGYYLNDYEFLLAYSDVTSYPVTSLQGSGVFDLLSSGFSSMLPILNIAILPGITFGLLVFLPIIAGIIVVIIKVIKK